MKKLAPIFFIAIITLTIPFLFHLILWKDNQISEQNILSGKPLHSWHSLYMPHDL